MRQIRYFALAALVPLSSAVAFAQIDTGQINGTVTDQSGAVVSNAQVTERNVGTNATRTIPSAGNGTYVFTGLPAAMYEITVTAPGFESYTQQVEVTVNGHATLDARLTVGQGAEKVTVTAASGGAEVNTETQEVSQIVGEAQVAQLPSLTRNPYDFVAIAGNVSSGDASSQNQPQNANTRGIGFNINGQRSSGTEILLDGVENIEPFDDAVGQVVPLDTIQEYRVTTSNFTAQYGRASGGVVNVITKAGTNNLHGGAWEFNRLSAYTSNTYDNNAKGLKKGSYTRNQFGFELGGPIKKDKLFFYEGTEWLRVRSSAVQAALVMDPAFIAASSPATQAFYAAYAQGQPAASRGVITAADIVKTSSSALSPTSPVRTLPGDTPVFDRVSYTAPTDAGGGSPQNTYYLNGRLDYNLSPATQTYARYALRKLSDFSGYDYNSAYSQYNVGDTNSDNSVLWNISHIFSPTVLTNTKLSFTRFNLAQSFNTALEQTPTLFLFNNATYASTEVQTPGFYARTTGGGGLPFGGPQNTIQWNQDLTVSKGAHTMQFGGQVEYIQLNVTYAAYAQANNLLGTALGSGLDNFIGGNVTTFSAAVNPNGALPCVANYVTGQSTLTPSCTIHLPATQPNFARSDRFHDWAAYAQDSWKATSHLTLNYGVRYEYYGVQHNNKANLDSNFYYGAGPGISNEVRNGQIFTVPNSPIKKLFNPSYGTVAPRVGFAWDVFGTGKTSFRGGYGISYERNFGNVTFNVIQNPPNYAVVQVRNQPLTSSNAGPLGAANGAVPLPPTSVRNIDQNIRTAQTQFWSAAVDQQLAANTVVSFQYVAARGVHLYDIKNYNERGVGNIQLGDPFTPAGTTGFHYSRPNNEYSSINNRGSNGDSYYEALNVQFQSTNFHRTGLSLVANYTWGKSIDDVSSTFSESNSASNGVGNLGYLNPYNPGLDRGLSDFDIRNRFVLAPIWDTPWFKNQHTLKGETLGGYNVSGIYTVRTGTPFTFSDSTNSLNAGFGQGIVRYAPAAGGQVPLRATKIQSANYDQTPNNFVIDTLPQALNYSNPAYGGISDFGPYPATMTKRNAFSGPGAWNVDLAVSKSFPIREGMALEARAEGFNILNHANLYVNGPNNDVANFGYTDPQTGSPVQPVVEGKKGGVNGGQYDERRFGQFAVKVTF